MTVEKMKFYYDNGLWSLERVDKLLAADKITQEEYDYIIGKTTDAETDTE